MLQVKSNKLILDNKTTNFDVREWVPENIFRQYGVQSIRFINEGIVRVAQFSRDWFDSPHRMNNWHQNWRVQGSKFELRGYRPPLSGLKAMITKQYGKEKYTKVEAVFTDLGHSQNELVTGSWVSDHKLGMACDYTVDGLTADRVRKEILDNQQEFLSQGLTILEDGQYAPTWCHASIRATGVNYIVLIKP